MNRENKLTQGNIAQVLISLAIPIMGTSFIHMAYSMIDMIWIGRLGSNAVAAVGTAGFFPWLAFALIVIPKIGAEVGVAQSIGRENRDEARTYIKHAIQLVVLLGIIYSLILIIFRNSLIDFFGIEDKEVIEMAISYLVIISFGIIFYFLNPVFTGILNGYGNSKIPFKLNAIGLFTNIVLDPILIFGIGPFPAMGVKGAAIATIFAQFVVSCSFIYYIIKSEDDIFKNLHLLKKPDELYMKKIIKLGLPTGLQSGLFTFFAMIITKVVASWGPVPIAVQNIGAQIESISWMTAEGFATAISAFVGQNYGAKKWDRIKEGYFMGLKIVSVVGILATFLLFFFGGSIFKVFISEPETISMGVVYLKILSISQIFMTIEIVSAGAFNGLGKTVPPSVVGIIFNGLRIPSAILLSRYTFLGLNGIWLSISVSSIFKGSVLTIWFLYTLYKRPSTEVINKSHGL